MRISVLLLDDSATDIGVLERHLQVAAEEFGAELEVHRSTSPDESLKVSEDVVFVDVMMPAVLGIDLIPRLRERSAPDTMYVLMSSQHGFIKEGYSVEAFDFLHKPFLQSEVTAVLKRIASRMKMREPQYMMIHTDESEHKILFRDIMAIMVDHNYATVYMVKGRLCYRDTVKKLLRTLPPWFVQVSVNTIVNVNFIASILPDCVEMREKELTFELQKNYRYAAVEAFTEAFS